MSADDVDPRTPGSGKSRRDWFADADNSPVDVPGAATKTTDGRVIIRKATWRVWGLFCLVAGFYLHWFVTLLIAHLSLGWKS